MTVKTYQSTNKTLLDNSWFTSDDAFYFQLVSSDYTFDATHTTIFEVQTYLIGSTVEVTGKSVQNAYMTCNDIIPPAVTAAYAIIYVGEALVFFLELNGGSDYTFDGSLKVDITTLLNYPASTSTFTSQIKSYHYDSALRTLYSDPFAVEGNIYTAQLLSDGYTFNSSHSSRVDIAAYSTGTQAVLTGKTISYSGNTTTIDCGNIAFASTYNAAHMAVLFSPSGAPQNADDLVLLIDFNSGDAVSVDQAVKIESTGLLTINRAI